MQQVRQSRNRVAHLAGFPPSLDAFAFQVQRAVHFLAEVFLLRTGEQVLSDTLGRRADNLSALPHTLARNVTPSRR